MFTQKRKFKLLVALAMLFMSCFLPETLAHNQSEQDVKSLKCSGDSIYDHLYENLSELEKTASDGLISHHWKSLKAIFQTEYIAAEIAQGKRLEMLQKTTKTMLNWLPEGEFPVSHILSGRNRLIYSFISKRDQTLQPYALRLPKNWEKDKAYPLIVILHGNMGKNPSQLLFISWEFKIKLGDRSPAEYPAYMLEVYGRGNTYYQGIGEVDVFEAMEDVKSRFNVDEDRIYLTGQSMGGGGGWNIATRTPDVWAAVSLFCPAFFPQKAPYLPENMEGLPVRFWYGGKDRIKYKTASLKSHEYLQSLGFDSEVHTTKDAGHGAPKEQRHESTLWLLKHTRTKPLQFKYLIDTREHNGRNGIFVTGKSLSKELSEINCKIEGNKVIIDTKNCTELLIRPKADGLDIQTETIIIIWNGKEKYNAKLEDIIELSI